MRRNLMRPGGFATHDLKRAEELARYHDPARGPFEPHTPRGTRRDMSPPPERERTRLQPLCLSCGEDIAVHDGLCLTCNPPLRVGRLAESLDIDLSGVEAIA